MDDERKRLVYEARVYEEQLILLQREIERMMLTLVDLNNAIKTMESLEKGEALVPIGGGALIKSTVISTGLLMPIGGGYAMEMKKEEAIEELKKRTERTEKAIDRLRGEFDRVSAKMNETSKKLEKMQAGA